jgi:tetratricopeptide (TPR) repeat protein
MTECDLTETQTRYYQRYYRLALAAAQRRDLSGASLYARYALALNPEHEGAAILLSLCLDELGEAVCDTPDALEKVRVLAGQKKWREAEKAAKSIPRQSVRILNIRACLLAAAKRYVGAASCFAKALAMDRGNALASEGLAEVAEITARRKWWWVNG